MTAATINAPTVRSGADRAARESIGSRTRRGSARAVSSRAAPCRSRGSSARPRRLLINRIRMEIAARAYLTESRIDAAVERLLVKLTA